MLKKNPEQGEGEDCLRPSQRESNKEILFEKILGCLAMVAIGDALGMPSHDMTSNEIKARFGGPIRKFESPFKDSRVHGEMRAGQTTDDTGLTLTIARAYTENKGRITPHLIGNYITDWVNKAMENGLANMIGRSTKQAVLALKKGMDPKHLCHQEKNPMIGSTNGGAMKISPVGLVHPGNIDAVVRDTVKICLPTHGTQTGIAAACAIASGVSEALMPKATVFSVIRAALAGSRKGEEAGMKIGRTVPLPSVPQRIEWAVSIALNSRSLNRTLRCFSETIGTGLPAYESVPTAIGIFLACNGDPKRCALAGANIGNDTDTIASMAGALSGALKGFQAIPKEWFKTVEEVNRLNLVSTAEALFHLSTRAT